ncbi:MAG: sulfurtransferase TusA family protein [Candidatus Omnitrophica bacterium]|nr:sulfurtransferase TusA family protein [Candidatus Omnitrophota bacterium]
MDRPPTVTVDVRDMVCAQALAVVARVVARLKPGEAAEVSYTTDDVKRDLLVWCADRGYGVQERTGAVFRIEPCR